MSKSVCGSCGNMEVVEIDEKGMDPLPGSTPGQCWEPDGAGFIKKRKAAKKKRLRTLGAWDATIPEGKVYEGEDVDAPFFMCGTERKVYGASDGPCAACPGGCHEEKGLPTLVEVEGLTEMDLGMKVVDSGYSPQADVFIVHAERKDGRIIEVLYDGSTAETLRQQLLPSDVLSGKDLESAMKIITSDEAMEIAQKQFDGEVLAVNADNFNGQDAWVVEMTDESGDDLDVFVGLDGSTLGYDVYEKSAAEATEENETELTEEVEEKGVKGCGGKHPDGKCPDCEDEVDGEDLEKKEAVEEKSINPDEVRIALAELESISLSI